ncbi:MAG: hypothetical protein HY704_05105 [Gemmatimonadetes bacterium]|nr:hypothetical protein [Gemmatimonadota bacterium]
MVTEYREFRSSVLPLETNALEFLDRLDKRGGIAPDLLTLGEAGATCWISTREPEAPSYPTLWQT